MNSSTKNTSFFFEPEILNTLALKNRFIYSLAQPFPHVVFDQFVPEDAVQAILDEFPTPREIEWRHHEHKQSKKLATENETQLGSFTRQFIYHLNSGIFLNFLEALTNIQGLIPDPHLWGGGLHQIERGGHLGIHADFNRHPQLNLDRRLNLLLYLNKDWKEEYGGHLQLWDGEMKTCKEKILPIFSRCVIFSTTDFSFHGHPDPLTCPEGESRKSLALYYYTNGRPTEEISKNHSTLYQKRPGEKAQKPSFLKSLLNKISPSE